MLACNVEAAFPADELGQLKMGVELASDAPALSASVGGSLTRPTSFEELAWRARHR